MILLKDNEYENLDLRDKLKILKENEKNFKQDINNIELFNKDNLSDIIDIQKELIFYASTLEKPSEIELIKRTTLLNTKLSNRKFITKTLNFLFSYSNEEQRNINPLIREVEVLKSDFNSLSNYKKNITQWIEYEEDNKVKDYLLSNNKKYKDLINDKEKVRLMILDINTLLGLSLNLRGSIEEASSMETLDAFSSNKGISMLSHMENQKVQSDLDSLNNHIQKFQFKYENIDFDNGSSFNDLMFDLADLNVFGFFASLSILDQLSELKTKNEDLLEHLRTEKDKMSDVFSIYNTEIDSYINDLKQFKTKQNL